MVNKDVLIKVARNRGFVHNWPDQVNYMRERLKQIKLGFPGLRNDHFDLIELKDVKDGDLFIIDPYIESVTDSNDTAPILYKLEGSKLIIEGIGKGLDLTDEYRTKRRWKDELDSSSLNNMPRNSLVLRVNVRPKLTGGPGYYYFFKSYRDMRV